MCSKKIPPIHFEAGKRNMLYPKVVGQSGTARPTPLLVTMPPLQIRNSVATDVTQANRCSHLERRSMTADEDSLGDIERRSAVVDRRYINGARARLDSGSAPAAL